MTMQPWFIWTLYWMAIIDVVLVAIGVLFAVAHMGRIIAREKADRLFAGITP